MSSPPALAPYNARRLSDDRKEAASVDLISDSEADSDPAPARRIRGGSPQQRANRPGRPTRATRGAVDYQEPKGSDGESEEREGSDVEEQGTSG
jgi:hypothetical protein